MYVVGRDWPDQLYSTNARWPVANQWHYKPKDGVHRQKATLTKQDVLATYELAAQRELKKQMKELKRQLFEAIIQVSGHVTRGEESSSATNLCLLSS